MFEPAAEMAEELDIDLCFFFFDFLPILLVRLSTGFSPSLTPGDDFVVTRLMVEPEID